MTSQPWMKFYPADWRADPALRSCSLSARGMWMEMLAIMHEASTRGELTINSRPVSARQMAALAGCTEDDAVSYMTELERAGVFSRRKNGVIYSRRMERDENSARKNRENGKKGGNPTLRKQTENEGPVNPRDKAQKPEARSQINSGADAPAAAARTANPDWRDLCWKDGVAAIMRLTSKTLPTARTFLGQLVKLAQDDCRLVFEKIQMAERDRVVDPASWLMAAVRSQPPPTASNAMKDAVARFVNGGLH